MGGRVMYSPYMLLQKKGPEGWDCFGYIVNEFHRQLVCGEVYSRIPGKNEETLAMISVYMFGKPATRLEALIS